MQFQYGRDDFYKCKKKSISNVILVHRKKC